MATTIRLEDGTQVSRFAMPESQRPCRPNATVDSTPSGADLAGYQPTATWNRKPHVSGRTQDQATDL